jgi:hypothetical protein
MRGEGGLAEIEKSVQKLSDNHKKHLKFYDPHDGKALLSIKA